MSTARGTEAPMATVAPTPTPTRGGIATWLLKHRVESVKGRAARAATTRSTPGGR